MGQGSTGEAPLPISVLRLSAQSAPAMRCIYEEKREAALAIEARCAVPHAAPTLHARKKNQAIQLGGR
jgi:hypothetical protein